MDRRSLGVPQATYLRRPCGHDRVRRDGFIGGDSKECRELQDQGLGAFEQANVWRQVVSREGEHLPELFEPALRQPMMRSLNALRDRRAEIGAHRGYHGSSFAGAAASIRV